MTNLNLGVYLVIGFLLVNLAIGLWAGRGVKTMTNYVIANRRFGVIPLVLTYIATSVGDGPIFRGPFEIFSFGLGLIICEIGGLISDGIIRPFFIASRITKFRKCLTLSDMMGQIFGINAKIFTGLISCIYSLLVSGFQIWCMGIVFQTFLGINNVTGMILSGLVLVIYSAFGGIRAVISTDIFQFIAAAGTLLFITAVAVYKIGGLDKLFVTLHDIYPNKLKFINAERLPYYLSVFIMLSVFSIEIFEPCRIQRVLMSKNSQQLKKFFFSMAIFDIILVSVITILTLAAVVLYPDSDPNNVVINLCKNIIPTKLHGLLAVGFIAMFISTGDSYLHSAGVSFSYDFVSPLIRKIGKEIDELFWTKVSTFMLGIGAILFAIFEGYKIRLDYIFCLLGLYVASPLSLGIFGFAATARTYWVSCVCSTFAFIICNLTSSSIAQDFSLVIAMTAGALGFLWEHLYTHGKFNIEEHINIYDSSAKSNRVADFIKDLLLFPINFVDILKKKVAQNNAPYTLFGFLYTIILVLPYFFWPHCIPTIYEETILYIRIVGVFICSLLMSEARLPSIFRRYLPTFWYLALTYCLPFLSTVMLIVTNGSIEYLVEISITVMLLMLLVDWISVIGICLFGTGAGIVLCKYYLGIDLRLNFDTSYLIIYQILCSIVIGLCFARRKHLSLLESEFKVNIIQKLQLDREQELHAARSANSRVLKTIGNGDVDILAIVTKMKYLLKHNNYDEATSQLSLIEEYMKSVVEKATTHIKLRVSKVRLEEFIDKIENLAKIVLHKDISVILRSDIKYLEIDEIAVYKILLLGLNDLQSKIKQDYQNSAIYILMDISDAKITYVSDKNMSYTNILNGFKIIFSTIQNFDPTTFDKMYVKELRDNIGKVNHTEKDLKTTSLVPIDKNEVDRLLDAHCGVSKWILKDKNYTYVYVFPQKVWEIRPKNLDIDNPTGIVEENSQAIEIENKFKKELTEIATNTSMQNVERALGYMKKYHNHQKRSSGEPYYIHPLSVARILIRMIDYKSSKISHLLWENQEAALIAALLHDTLEDTTLENSEIKIVFGKKVSDIVLATTKINRQGRLAMMTNTQAFSKFISQEPISVCIKIADRLHNIQTVDGHSTEQKRKAVAQETLDFFVTPALNLGFDHIARDLESASKWVLKHGRLGDFKLRHDVTQ